MMWMYYLWIHHGSWWGKEDTMPWSHFSSWSSSVVTSPVVVMSASHWTIKHQVKCTGPGDSSQWATLEVGLGGGELGGAVKSFRIRSGQEICQTVCCWVMSYSVSLSGFLMRCSLQFSSGAFLHHGWVSGFLSSYEILCLQQRIMLILLISHRPLNHMCFRMKGQRRAHKILIFIRTKGGDVTHFFLALVTCYRLLIMML